MVRKIRQALAIVFLLCVTLLFLDFTGTAHAWLGWMAKVYGATSSVRWVRYWGCLPDTSGSSP